MTWSGGSLSCSRQGPAPEGLVPALGAVLLVDPPCSISPRVSFASSSYLTPWLLDSIIFLILDSLHCFQAACPPAASQPRVLGESLFRLRLSESVMSLLTLR